VATHPSTPNSELKIAAASCHAVEQRASKTLRWAEQQRLPQDIALNHLTLGRAAIYRAILEKSEVRSAKSEVDQAVASLRGANVQEFIVLGLLTRAWLGFLMGRADGAKADLDEAWEIAERGPMRLFLADIRLCRARLFRDKAELVEARKLIEQCGYWRRREELEDAEEAAKRWA
jgi:hypothetical protein